MKLIDIDPYSHVFTMSFKIKFSSSLVYDIFEPIKKINYVLAVDSYMKNKIFNKVIYI